MEYWCLGQWNEAELDSIETLMREDVANALSEAAAAARLPRSMRQRIRVDVIHRQLRLQGKIVDQCLADKVLALVIWDTARGRDMQETIVSSMGCTNDDTWQRLLARLQMAVMSG